MKKRIYIIFGLLIMLSLPVHSQYIQFSQFYSSPMNLGPSFTGMTDGSRAVINYRDQWPKIPKTYVTYAASYDNWFDKINSGIGILVVRDQAGNGNLSLTDYGVCYSWDGRLVKQAKGEWHIRPGIQFKYSQRGIDFHKLIFNDQLMRSTDPTSLQPSLEPPPESKKGYLDITTSLLLYYPTFWLGSTQDHLLRPNQSLTADEARVPIKYSVYGGYKFVINKGTRRQQFAQDKESVTVNFHYRLSGGYDQLDFGAYWQKDPFTLGVWARGLPVVGKMDNEYGGNLDAVIFLVGYRIYGMRVGYSYDFTVSKLIGSTGGAHEISIVYEFTPTFVRKVKHAAIPCPKL